jgi:hypothetical protein
MRALNSAGGRLGHALRRLDRDAVVTVSEQVFMPLRRDDGLRGRLAPTRPMLEQVARRLQAVDNLGHRAVIYHWRKGLAPSTHEGVWQPELELVLRFADDREAIARSGQGALRRHREIAARLPRPPAIDLTWYVLAVVEGLSGQEIT